VPKADKARIRFLTKKKTPEDLSGVEICVVLVNRIAPRQNTTRDSYDAISVSMELLAQSDQILTQMTPPASASRPSGALRLQ